jgi:hypothetical protein
MHCRALCTHPGKPDCGFRREIPFTTFGLIPMNENAKHLLDGASMATAVAALAAWLPPLAALASLVWTLIRIYETRTVQGWVKKWRGK